MQYHIGFSLLRVSMNFNQADKQAHQGNGYRAAVKKTNAHRNRPEIGLPIHVAFSARQGGIFVLTCRHGEDKLNNSWAGDIRAVLLLVCALKFFEERFSWRKTAKTRVASAHI
jgi:hypothetical protein